MFSNKRAVNLHVIHGSFEAVEKLTFSEQPLARNHAFERILKKNRALTGTFFLPLYKFRDTQGELPHSGKRGWSGPCSRNLWICFANSILCVLPHETQNANLTFLTDWNEPWILMWFTARFCVHPHPANHFYYCYGGTLHNSDALSTDNPALYHNYFVYIFLTPFDPYCHLHSPIYIYRIISSVSPAIFSKSLPVHYSKKCFLPIDKNMDLQYTLN